MSNKNNNTGQIEQTINSVAHFIKWKQKPELHAYSEDPTTVTHMYII